MTNNYLKQKRDELSQIDYEMIELLGRRFQITTDIGLYKKKNHISPYQPEQRKKHLSLLIKKGKEMNLDIAFIKEFYKTIHRESLKLQKEITKDS